MSQIITNLPEEIRVTILIQIINCNVCRISCDTMNNLDLIISSIESMVSIILSSFKAGYHREMFAKKSSSSANDWATAGLGLSSRGRS